MSFYGSRPLNFGHRGASHRAPANTLAAFRKAADLGADGIELDVQLSRDGALVVIHDFSLEATTDGHGLVRTKTLAELRQLHAGSRFDAAFAGERIPTLQEVIEAVGDRLLLNIELKTPALGDDGLARRVVRLVEERGLAERVVLSSFNPLAIWRARRLNPAIATGLIYSARMRFLPLRPRLRHWRRPSALHPHHSLVDGGYMDWARAHGYRVNVWTVDEPAEMRRLIQLGVDVIITNEPDLLGQVLADVPG